MAFVKSTHNQHTNNTTSYGHTSCCVCNPVASCQVKKFPNQNRSKNRAHSSCSLQEMMIKYMNTTYMISYGFSASTILISYLKKSHHGYHIIHSKQFKTQWWCSNWCKTKKKCIRTSASKKFDLSFDKACSIDQSILYLIIWLLDLNFKSLQSWTL